MNYKRSQFRTLIQALTAQELYESLDDFPDVRNQFTDGQEKSLRENIILDYFEKHQEDKFPNFLKAIRKCNTKASSDYALESLKTIFDTSDQEELLKNLTPIYSHFFSEFQGDWQPNNIKDFFEQLQGVYKKEGSLIRVAKFIVNLIHSRKFSEAINNALNKWCEINTDNINKLLEENKYVESRKSDNENYLIILIYPSHQLQQHKSFHVEGWILFDIKPDELNSTSIIKSQPLEITNTKQQFLFEEICGYVLKDFINQAIDKLEEIPTIELFLPYDLLSEPIDTLIPKSEDEMTDDDDLPIPIGVKYKVHIRSYERIKKFLKTNKLDEKIILWQKKWSILQASYTESCVNCFISAEINDNWEDIYSNLNSNQIIGLKLLHIPSEDILKVINQTGTPIALWLRYDLENSSLQLDFEEILKCSLIRELSDKIQKTRLDAFKNKYHIGNHISLLLDNPYILPPKIHSSFTLPTEL